MEQQTWLAKLTETLDTRREFEQELAVCNATELVTRVMEERGVTKAELARMLGTSRANITRLLSGSRNLTVRTLADLTTILGVRVKFESEALRGEEYVMTPPQVLRRNTSLKSPIAVEAAPAASTAVLLSEALAA